MLYQKHRPQELSEIIGNQSVISMLEKMLEDASKCPHAFLLHGDTGTGKTTVARIIASKLGCSGLDLKEVDTADFRGIDTIREVRKQSQYQPLESACRVWILDECHKLSNDAQNALLKILEDTPKHVYFILCTTEPQKLIKTIKGRCSQIQMKPLTENEMIRLLRISSRKEKIRLDKEIYEQIAQDSLGLPRNALQILEQVLAADPEGRLETAKKAAEEQSQSIELCRALISGAGWKKVSSILEGLKDQDAESIRRHILYYCQAVLLKSNSPKAAHIIEELWEPLYNIGFPGLVYVCYSIAKS